jgi:predicted RNase H-like nuclease (RuvC/YqgF family)
MKKLIFLFLLIPFLSFAQEIDPWDQLENFVNQGLEALDQSDENLQQIQEKIDSLTANNKEQELLLLRSQEIVDNLKKSLEESQANLDKAGTDIIEIDDINQRIADLALEISKENERLLKQRKLAPFASLGGISLGVGSAIMMMDGIQKGPDGIHQTTIGAALIGIDIAVWSLGYWVFSWW